MVDVEKLKAVHIEFIDWLKTKKNISNIDSYISYATEKLQLYDKCVNTKDFRPLQTLPRTLNRYRDEFEFDSDSIKQAYAYFDKMRKEIDVKK